MLNRNQLAIFYAVFLEKGFGRAARRLRISQPAVSVQVAQLEDAIGVRLFERVGRSIVPTEAGERLAVYAGRIASLETEAEAAMKDLGELRDGRLRIGASSTIAAWLLPQLMWEFRSRWPRVQLHMQVGNSSDACQHLLDGLVDLALVEGLPAAFESPIEAEVFREDQLVPIAAYGHPLVKARRPKLAAFLKEPFITREPGSGTRAVVAQYLNEKGFSVEPAYSLAGTEAVKGAVAAGLGVAFVSSLTVAGDFMLKRLGIVRLQPDGVIRRPFYVLRIKGNIPQPQVQAFLSIMRSR